MGGTGVESAAVIGDQFEKQRAIGFEPTTSGLGSTTSPPAETVRSPLLTVCYTNSSLSQTVAFRRVLTHLDAVFAAQNGSQNGTPSLFWGEWVQSQTAMRVPATW